MHCLCREKVRCIDAKPRSIIRLVRDGIIRTPGGTAIMACKSPPNFRDLHRKCCQPRDTKETGGLPVRDDHGLYPPALREMLGSDNYQMVLVPRGEWNRIRGSQAEPFSPALT